MSQYQYVCPFPDCVKQYKTPGGYLNHQTRVHNVMNPVLPNQSQVQNPNQNNQHPDLQLKEAVDEGWDKDQLELALKISLKDSYNKQGLMPNDEEMEKLNEEHHGVKNCRICLSCKSEVALVPCGHMICCNDCGKTLLSQEKCNRRCPVCRKVVRCIMKIYL